MQRDKSIRPDCGNQDANPNRLARQRRRDTGIELAVRRGLWSTGYRYRVDQRPIQVLRTRADIVFRSEQVAIYIDGCFWHGCEDHIVWPKHNGDWWKKKLETNRWRDRVVVETLNSHGWTCLRFWEHEEVGEIINKISERLEAGRKKANGCSSEVR